MKQLKKMNWITEQEKKKTGKVMPTKLYSLKVELNEMITQFEEQQNKSIDEARENIERLKKLGNKLEN